MIKVFCEHSVDISLLSGGVCIDVGCRGFGFSEAMRDLGCQVVAFDMETFETPEGIDYKMCAISNWTGNGEFRRTSDPQAMHLLTGSGNPIEVRNINDIYQELQDKYGMEIDILKLDCEGSEYDILADDSFLPFPKQISVEFHQHCQKAKHILLYDKAMANLLKNYVAIKHDRYQAHGAGFNYWDSLFIRKDLINNHE